MHKRIGYCNLTASLARWLLTGLRQAPGSAQGKSAFEEEIRALVCGKTSSLMLEYDGSEQDFAEDRLCFGPLVIYPCCRRITVGKQDIALTPKEYDILLFLAKNRGMVFSKEQIYQAVWADEYLMDDNNIMAFIRKLRKKIEPDPDVPQFILTVWGVGYKFNERI